MSVLSKSVLLNLFSFVLSKWMVSTDREVFKSLNYWKLKVLKIFFPTFIDIHWESNSIQQQQNCLKKNEEYFYSFHQVFGKIGVKVQLSITVYNQTWYTCNLGHWLWRMQWFVCLSVKRWYLAWGNVASIKNNQLATCVCKHFFLVSSCGDKCWFQRLLLCINPFQFLWQVSLG